MRILLSILLAIVVLLGLRWSFYTVDAGEYAYVTVLGRHVATYDGADAEQAGLHFGWPWPIQVVQRFDRRLQTFDLPATELLTRDAKGKIDKNLSVEAYVCWKIAGRDAVDRFIQRLGSAERAREILGSRIKSQLGDAISQMRFEDLVSTEKGTQPGKTHVDDTAESLQARLLARLQPSVLNDYGIDLLDIRLRRFNHSGEVRTSIFERIKSERYKKVADYAEEGKLLASNIESEAEKTVRELNAKARFEEEQIKSKADAEALRIRNEAQSQDPEFYAFLKKMEKLQSILGESKSVLLLSTHRPMFDLLFDPPQPKTPAKEKKE